MIHNIRNYKIFTLFKTSSNKNKLQEIPFVEKPIMANMFMQKEPENFFGDPLGFGKLFKDSAEFMFKKVEEVKKDVEIIKEVAFEIKKDVKVKSLPKPKFDFKFESMKKEDIIPMEIPKIPRRPRTTWQKYQSKLQYFLYDVEEFVSHHLKFFYKHKVWKKEERIAKRIEERRQKDIEKIMLESARRNFLMDLRSYNALFSPDDVKPEYPGFKAYKSLDLKDILKQQVILTACIKHQEDILKLKERYTNSTKKNCNEIDLGNIKNCKLQNITRNNHGNKNFNYQKELKQLCLVFMQNSKEIENPMLAFHHISKIFFKSSKNNIEEIFKWNNRYIWKFLERIPKFGLVPKAVRVADQINLTRCILNDFENVTKEYVKKGINPIIKKYNHQYEYIEKFVNSNKANFSLEDQKFTEQCILKVKKVRDKRIKTYATLYDTFAKGGINIKNICNNIRFKSGLAIAIKSFLTFSSPF